MSIEEGDAKSRDFGVMFIETSAKAGFNIKVEKGFKPMFFFLVLALDCEHGEWSPILTCDTTLLLYLCHSSEIFRGLVLILHFFPSYFGCSCFPPFFSLICFWDILRTSCQGLNPCTLHTPHITKNELSSLVVSCISDNLCFQCKIKIAASIPEDCFCFARNGNPFLHKTGRHGRREPEAQCQFISDRTAGRRLCLLENVSILKIKRRQAVRMNQYRDQIQS